MVAGGSPNTSRDVIRGTGPRIGATLIVQQPLHD